MHANGAEGASCIIPSVPRPQLCKKSRGSMYRTKRAYITTANVTALSPCLPPDVTPTDLSEFPRLHSAVPSAGLCLLVNQPVRVLSTALSRLHARHVTIFIYRWKRRN